MDPFHVRVCACIHVHVFGRRRSHSRVVKKHFPFISWSYLARPFPRPFPRHRRRAVGTKHHPHLRAGGNWDFKQQTLYSDSSKRQYFHFDRVVLNLTLDLLAVVQFSGWCQMKHWQIGFFFLITSLAELETGITWFPNLLRLPDHLSGHQ